MDQNANNISSMMKECSNATLNNVAIISKAHSKIKWKKVSFVIPMTPKPSQRPRLSGYRVYVPGASKNGTFFNNNVLPTLKNLFITTPCRIKLDIYVETPVSFTKTQKMLAEMKILRPWTSTGDVDNYEKAVFDMMQPNEKRGHVGIMQNDCLIIESHTNKYYSRNPRYEVMIAYMDNIPESILNPLKLKDKIN